MYIVIELIVSYYLFIFIYLLNSDILLWTRQYLLSIIVWSIFALLKDIDVNRHYYFKDSIMQFHYQ